MRRVMEWCVPKSAFWSWRDAQFVFYDRFWITVDPRDRIRYMAYYRVDVR